MSRLARRHPAAAYVFIREPIVSAAVPPYGVAFLPTFISGYAFGIRSAFGADPTTDPATWTFTDISSSVYQPEPPTPAISITRGKADEQGVTAPAQCTFTLKNLTGAYTPRRPSSANYPYMKVGLAVQAFIATSSTTYERFAGRVTELAPGWDTSGNWAYVVVTAAGIFHQMEQGTDALRSAQYRAITSGQPIAYWPMEDGSLATAAASAVSGVAALAISGTVTYAGATGPAGSSALPSFTAGPSFAANIPAGSSTSWRVEFDFQVPTTATLSDNPAIVEFTTSGTSERYVIYAGPAGFGLSLTRWTAGVSTGYNASGAAPALSDGLPRHVRMDGTTAGGTYGFNIYLNGVLVMSDSGLAGTLGAIGKIRGNTGSISTPAGPVTEFDYIGHLAVYAPFVGATDTYQAFLGYAGETAAARMSRLCDEESIPFLLYGTDGGRTMGAQAASTLYDLLREAETVGGGVLEDGVNFGLRYSELETRYNQAAAMTPTLNQLDPPLRPVENDLKVRNEWTVSRPSGSSETYTQPAGQPYAPTGAGGVTTYGDSKSMNVEDDTTLLNRAAWLTRLTTVDADRYPQLRQNLAARTALITSWLACANGSRIVVGSNYSTGGPAPDVLVEGWSEDLSTFVWAVQENCAPTDPWFVGVTDDAAYGFLDPTGSTLGATWDGVSTGAVLTVNTASGPLWSTSGADYPVDVNIGGQRVTISGASGASSPQTLTVSVASVNGVSVSHASTTAVQPWFGFVLTV